MLTKAGIVGDDGRLDWWRLMQVAAAAAILYGAAQERSWTIFYVIGGVCIALIALWVLEGRSNRVR